MPNPSLPTFNLFKWSLLIFVPFALLQAVLTVILSFSDQSTSQALALFIWFACSASVGTALVNSHRPKRSHFMLLQGFACLYPMFLTAAILWKSGSAVTLTQLTTALSAIALFYLTGCIGFLFSLVLHQRLQQ